jgi:hypothetical protein
MLEWFRRLAADDQGPAPDGAEVERDELGRVVKATLSAEHPRSLDTSGAAGSSPNRTGRQHCGDYRGRHVAALPVI